MKKYLFIFLLVGICFGQDKYRFFLKNDDNLKLLGEERYQIIKNELDKMLNDYLKKINLDKYWIEKYTQEVPTGPARIDEKTYIYYRDLYKDTMGMEWAVTEAKRLATYTPTEEIEKERNRVFNKGEKLFTKEIQWLDIVSYYGGYAEIGKKGIKKEDTPLYNIDVIFEKIELINQSECLVHIIIKGTDDALKIYNAPKANYKYKGSYKINYDKSYLALMGDIAVINFSFDEKKYLPKSHTKIQIPLRDVLPKVTDYKNTILTMFDDFVTDEDYNNLNPDLIAAKKALNEEFEIRSNECINAIKSQVYISLSKEFKKAKKEKFYLSSAQYRKNKKKLKKLKSHMEDLRNDSETTEEMIDKFITYAIEAGLSGTKLVPDPKSFKNDFLKPFNCDMNEINLSPRGTKNFINFVKAGSTMKIKTDIGTYSVSRPRKNYKNRIAFDEKDYPYNHLWIKSFSTNFPCGSVRSFNIEPLRENTYAYLNVFDERYGGIHYNIPVKKFECSVAGKYKKRKTKH